MNIYLNTAATGIVDENNIQDSIEYLRKLTVNPMAAFMDFMMNERDVLRQRAADLMGTDSENIAFTANFSTAQSQVADALQGKRKNVLLYRHDYPSVRMPFERRDFKVTYIDDKDGFTIDINELEEIIIREKIDILPISHVQFLSGFALDISSLSEICERHDVICILDTTQSLGAMPISFSWPGIDVMISASYKWLRAGHGAGIIAVSERFIKEFPPRSPGFGSMTLTPEGWFYEDSARGFEAGHPNVTTLYLLSNALNSAMQYGLDTIKNDNDTLMSHLIEGILTTKYDIIGTEDLQDRLHILCVNMPEEIYKRMLEKGIATTWRKGSMRISPHYYNTMDEIREFVKILGSV